MRRVPASVLIACASAVLVGCHSEPLGESTTAVEANLAPAYVLRSDPSPPPRWRIEDRMAHHNVPAVSIAVIDHGEIAWARAWGVAETGTDRSVNADTLFQSASIGKMVTAATVLAMADRGLLDLDADVTTYLESWQIPDNEYTGEGKVTLARLLSHTAGFRKGQSGEFDYDTAMPTLLQLLNGEPPSPHPPVALISTPGTSWLYSNVGFYVIQQVIEDLTGRSFPEVVEELVFGPLGMSRSVYMQRLSPELEANAAFGHEHDGSLMDGRYHVFPAFGSGSGLWTTPTDLARLAIEIQDAAAGRSSRLFSRRLASRMLMPVMESYGLGIHLASGPEPAFYHGGGTIGFRSQLIAFRDTGKGVVVMTNGMGGMTLKNEVVRSVAEVFDWPDYRSRVKEAVSLEPEVLRRYQGPYLCPGFPSVMLRVVDARLISDFFMHPGAELHADSHTSFFTLGQWVSYDFQSIEDGLPHQLILELDGSRHVFRPAHEGHPEIAVIFSSEDPGSRIGDDELADAVGVYRRLRDTGSPAAEERFLNGLGYQLRETNLRAALALLTVNTLLYPTSANTYDSLAEVSFDAGDTVAAAENYRKVLEVVDLDPGASEEFKNLLRDNTTTRLAAIDTPG